MACRKLGKIVTLRGAEIFKRQKCRLQLRDQPMRPIEVSISKPGPWLGGVQRGRLAAPELGEFTAEARKVAREAFASGLRTGAAQQRQFEHLDGVLESALGAAQPAQRMLEPPRHRFCREPRENSR